MIHLQRSNKHGSRLLLAHLQVWVAIALESELRVADNLDHILGWILAVAADAVTQAVAILQGIREADLGAREGEILTRACDPGAGHLDVDVSINLRVACEIHVDINDERNGSFPCSCRSS